MIKKIQEEHANWQIRNFGDVQESHIIIGVAEEVGELSHAYLHEKQFNRTNENHEENMKDAVADITIFLIALCNIRGWDYQKILEDTWQQVKKRQWKRFPENGITK